VKHLVVEMHGGTVIATSEGEGKGSILLVELPLAAFQIYDASMPQNHVGIETRATACPGSVTR
jgi:hypothetical protein